MAGMSEQGGKVYQGYNGQVTIDGDTLVVTRTGMVAKAGGLSGERRIPLASITDVAYRPATRLVNGQVRLGLNGTAPVGAMPGGSDPNSVVFTHKHREDFEELHRWLLSTVEHYRAAGAHQAGEEPAAPESAAGHQVAAHRGDASPAEQVAAVQDTSEDSKRAKWRERIGVDRPDIVDAASRLGWSLGGKREIKNLPSHLHPGETVRLLAQGTYQTNQGIVALTDQRLLFLFHGVMAQSQEDFPLRLITSVQTKSGFATGELHVTVSGMRSTISQVLKTDLAPLADAIRQGMAAAQSPSPAVAPTVPTAPPTADPFEALAKLGQLRDAGVITVEEFEAKKAEILARM